MACLKVVLMAFCESFDAARPVGAATAHNRSSEDHKLLIKALIKKDFPVPLTPLSERLQILALTLLILMLYLVSQMGSYAIIKDTSRISII